MNAIDKLKQISAFLESKGIENPAKEAEVLITETLKKELRVKSYELGRRPPWGVKERIYAGSIEINDETSELIDSLAARRAQGEPLQYIIGHVEFFGLKINVGRGVLIPRPETELLVEETIKHLNKKILPPHPPLEKGGRGELTGSRFTVLDLCTGSGCIAIALAKHFPNADVYGVDKSDDAIAYAIRNAIENDIRNVHFIKGDLFMGDSPESTMPFGIRNSGTVSLPVKNIKFDCIVSNPPYIRKGDIQNLQREVKDYEPLEALDGGEDGFDFYRKMLANAPKFLKENGIIILEIGHDQAEGVNEIAVNSGIRNIRFIKDYAGIRRIISGEI
ncbi:MAG: peptide chain release factor N(5)-glutamine methyltransferase [Nitrospirae bacterium]|nr:peptide chain release factor N(5)-glutamine methyltransferase [Nitrospirota bacterium]